MGWLKDFRKKQEELGAKPRAEAPKGDGKKPAKVPKPPRVEVLYKCGHTCSVTELKNHDCHQCQKRKGKPGKKGKGKGRPLVARLPRRSLYQLDYHEEGDRKWWTGSLTIPCPEIEALEKTFLGEAYSVHYLVDMLSKKWRDWKREREGSETEDAGAHPRTLSTEEEEAAKQADRDTVIPPECSA